MISTYSILYSASYQQSISCDPGLGWLIINPQSCFSLSADMGKNWISVGGEKETVKDERECQSAKINRWIKTNAYFTLQYPSFMYSPSSFSIKSFFIWRCQKAKKMLTNSRLGDSSIFICTRSKKKKYLQPLAALHPLLNTLSLPHSCKARLCGWLNF